MSPLARRSCTRTRVWLTWLVLGAWLCVAGQQVSGASSGSGRVELYQSQPSFAGRWQLVKRSAERRPPLCGTECAISQDAVRIVIKSIDNDELVVPIGGKPIVTTLKVGDQTIETTLEGRWDASSLVVTRTVRSLRTETRLSLAAGQLVIERVDPKVPAGRFEYRRVERTHDRPLSR